MSDEPQREMPVWNCHKKVRALPIAEAKANDDGTATLSFSEPGYAPITVDADYLKLTVPHGKGVAHLNGGYYVVYDDGYTSWSPAATFEAGYTRDKEY